MENMFKRTLLGAAIATAAMSGSANAAIELAGQAVQFYGQAAGSWIMIDNQDQDSAGADIESRIGFRGVVEFDDFAPNFIWQMEGGNANNGDNTGGLGARDTYLGFDFEGFGSIKYGRQLVAAYNYVDWPHSNPGLGNVFDWNNDLGVSYQDRANSVLRYDSANWGGFNLQATVSGMGTDTDQMVASLGTSYSTDLFSVHAGYYDRGSYETTDAEQDKYIIDGNGNVVLNPDYVAGGEKVTAYAHNYAVVGGSVYLGDVTLTAAYKAMETDSATGTKDQDAISATAQYVLNGKWVFKAGYASTSDTDGNDDGDVAITGRLGYILPSAFLYTDVRNYDMDGADDSKDNTRLLLGAEYYF
ncbi:porin [Vibrio makurazakiensis]|uniref:porin n=1 Tax=Vibrio makurazakiensis TaxID=2910250 RepID=UPI003D0B144E